MTDCQCGRKTDTYLCSECQGDLGKMLTGLAVGWSVDNNGKTYQSAGFIEHLEDARHGLTRLGMSARRSTEHSAPMLAHLGKNGDFTGSPAELLDDLHSLLEHWVGVVNTGTETLGQENP